MAGSPSALSMTNYQAKARSSEAKLYRLAKGPLTECDVNSYKETDKQQHEKQIKNTSALKTVVCL
jgi:hypothetical protein